MNTAYEKMEACQRVTTGDRPSALAALKASLADGDWRVRYAAVIAAGDMHAGVLVPALVEVLRQEDAAPLYSQVGEISGGPAGANTPMKSRLGDTDEATLDAWRRRGRIKQAVLWALAEIGVATPDGLSLMHKYAVDQKEDYAVRAAACRAMRAIGGASSISVLEQAAKDDEWCTNCEAKKSLHALKKNA